ncbi:uncharacterized protein LOC119730450 [Patiria miniata]|uniref:Uncharacterized protein n=1 Tax=Patiria miniata TaxID=46514 RepID=A0A914A789_PATMI|nr:uncharacterized protein LOC119730450 [Patiria miniata]
MGDVFIRLVKCLLERSSDRYNDDTRTHEALNKHVEFDDVTGLSKVQLEILQKLGEVILPKMLENESPVKFSKADFVNSCDNGQAILDVAIKIGLVRCEVDTYVYFVLEILRDICAGIALAHTAEQDKKWMAKLQHTDLMSAAETFSNVYVFACRKSQTVCSGLVQKIADCKKKETTNVIVMQTMTQLCLLLNFEGKCKGSLNAKFAGLFEGGKVRLGGVSGHTIRMLSYLFEHVDTPVEGVALCVESVELLRLENDDWGEFREYFEYFFPLNLKEDIQETEEMQRFSENGTLTKLRKRVESSNKDMPQFAPDQSDIKVLRTSPNKCIKRVSSMFVVSDKA